MIDQFKKELMDAFEIIVDNLKPDVLEDVATSVCEIVCYYHTNKSTLQDICEQLRLSNNLDECDNLVEWINTLKHDMYNIHYKLNTLLPKVFTH